jgi:hypothetical protein
MRSQSKLVAYFISTTLAVTAFGDAAHSSSRQPQNESQAERQAATLEDKCVGDLRTLNVAEIAYEGFHPEKGFTHSLKELGPKGENLVGPLLPTGEADGYRITLRGKGTPVRHYVILAKPVTRLVANQRSYFTDETGIIRFTTEPRAATKADPQIPQ